MVDAGRDDVPNDPSEVSDSTPDELAPSPEKPSRIGMVTTVVLVVIVLFVMVSFQMILKSTMDESATGPLTAESCIMDRYLSTWVGTWFAHFNVTVVNDGDADFEVSRVSAFIRFYQQGQQVNGTLLEWDIVLRPGESAHITEWLPIPFEPVPGDVLEFRVIIDWGTDRSDPFNFDQTV